MKPYGVRGALKLNAWKALPKSVLGGSTSV